MSDLLQQALADALTTIARMQRELEEAHRIIRDLAPTPDPRTPAARRQARYRDRKAQVSAAVIDPGTARAYDGVARSEPHWRVTQPSPPVTNGDGRHNGTSPDVTENVTDGVTETSPESWDIPIDPPKRGSVGESQPVDEETERQTALYREVRAGLSQVAHPKASDGAEAFDEFLAKAGRPLLLLEGVRAMAAGAFPYPALTVAMATLWRDGVRQITPKTLQDAANRALATDTTVRAIVSAKGQSRDWRAVTAKPEPPAPPSTPLTNG